MSSDQIPDAVVRLIANRIDSVPKLEAVLLLRRSRDHDWTAADTAVFLYVSPSVATYVLEMLTGLIHSKPATNLRELSEAFRLRKDK